MTTDVPVAMAEPAPVRNEGTELTMTTVDGCVRDVRLGWVPDVDSHSGRAATECAVTGGADSGSGVPQSQHQQLRRGSRVADTAPAAPSVPAGPIIDVTSSPPNANKAAANGCAVSGCAASEGAMPIEDAGLASGWVAWQTAEGRTYYWHETTRTSIWQRPCWIPLVDSTPRSPADRCYQRNQAKGKRRGHFQVPAHVAEGGLIRDISSPGGHKYRAVTLPPIPICPPTTPPPEPAAAE